ncbi:hypothetical protein BJ546DRAFT_856883 [Cryomyces antarcticus]
MSSAPSIISRSLRATTCIQQTRNVSRHPPVLQHCPYAYPKPLQQQRERRPVHTSPRRLAAPKSTDRGPTSSEDTQTDFGALNVLGSTPAPTTAIDACTSDGFALDNGLRVSGCGILLVAGEAFRWKPWSSGRLGGSPSSSTGGAGKLVNAKGQWEVDRAAWGILDLVWPKPDLLIIGTGPGIIPIAPSTRKHINELGIRLEVQDTRNASAQFNLLATERGVQQVAAALIPMGWREGR